MPLRDAMEILREHRAAGDVMITSMGSAREWIAMSGGAMDPLDFVFVPSSMGQAPSLALGVALAQPGRRVFACNGDGSTLMNLGALVTISAECPPNLVLIILDNGVYEVTGAQPTPGSASGRPDQRGVDFAEIARACGWLSVYRFNELDDWRECAAEAISSAGPVLIVLEVAPIPGAVGPKSPGPTIGRAQSFREALSSPK
ncbi:MAG TPA: thiamine pyrophosphate-dependent enzyme [Gemmatimonadaceae bacterium]|nr:thiamine pyrophosphate-dependent enzyme [Gemmatimonadaceae bacterium]